MYMLCNDLPPYCNRFTGLMIVEPIINPPSRFSHAVLYMLYNTHTFFLETENIFTESMKDNFRNQAEILDKPICLKNR